MLEIMNTVILIGHLGKDPDMSYTSSGIAVTKFTLAVTRNERSQGGEWQKETDWYNITAWGRDAETCNNYLKKGNKVYIEGSLTQRKYTDQNGVQRTANFVGGHTDNNDLGDLDEEPF
jgi:single-strand DNA-binding protein